MRTGFSRKTSLPTIDWRLLRRGRTLPFPRGLFFIWRVRHFNGSDICPDGRSSSTGNIRLQDGAGRTDPSLRSLLLEHFGRRESSHGQTFDHCGLRRIPRPFRDLDFIPVLYFSVASSVVIVNAIPLWTGLSPCSREILSPGPSAGDFFWHFREERSSGGEISPLEVPPCGEISSPCWAVFLLPCTSLPADGSVPGYPSRRTSPSTMVLRPLCSGCLSSPSGFLLQGIHGLRGWPSFSWR